MNFEDRTQLAQDEVQRVIASLPAEIRDIVAKTPVFFERRPEPSDVESGIYHDTLGLFDPGPAETARIRLWLDNIWEFAEEDPEEFVHEVKVTLLHEIGHLVGWDEEALEDRGLD